ncbi:hypothetical protein M3J09_008307 [Ascochyta lentis]
MQALYLAWGMERGARYVASVTFIVRSDFEELQKAITFCVIRYQSFSSTSIVRIVSRVALAHLQAWSIVFIYSRLTAALLIVQSLLLNSLWSFVHRCKRNMPNVFLFTYVSNDNANISKLPCGFHTIKV